MNSSFSEDISVQSDRVIATPSTLAKQTFYYVQETGHLKSIRSHVSKREKMESYLIVYVLSGEGYFTLNGKRTRVSTGACFFVDCMESYSHESPTDSSWELLWVHFNGSASKQYYEYFTGLSYNIFYPAASSEIIQTLKELLDVNKEKSSYHEAISSELITHLLTTLITTAKRTKSNTSSHPDSMDEKLRQIHHYLSMNYKRNISLEELEASFYVSRFHLCREFKKKYGESINDYLRSKRITQAKELLRFSKNSISDIAVMCGVADVNYFIKLFKAAEDMTPSEYRKKWIG